MNQLAHTNAPQGVHKNKNFFWITMFFALVVCFIGNQWVLGENNWFIFDDFAHLYRSKFVNIEEFFLLFPTARYNDRPVGWIIMKIMYLFYGMNASGHHLFLLLIHLFNVFLVGHLVYLFILLFPEYKKWNYLPALTAAVFGLWPNSTMSIQWISALFDLAGATFALLCFNLYLEAKLRDKYTLCNGVLIGFFLILGLRTKEMLVIIPSTFIIFDVLMQGKKLINKKRALLIPIASVVIASIYMVVLFTTPSSVVADSSSPYFMSFNPYYLFRNLIRYGTLFFGFSVTSMRFVEYDLFSSCCMILLSGGFLWGVYLALRKNDNALVFVFIAALSSIAPVLPMVNMQHMLYLYIPSIFFAVIIAFAILSIGSLLSTRYQGLYFIVALAGLVIIQELPRVRDFRNWWQVVASENRKTYIDLASIYKPEGVSEVYVEGAHNNTNIFIYGPGFVNNLVFNDRELKTVLAKEQGIPDQNAFVLEYSDGTVIRRGS